jgi:hypothetical protein
MNLRLTPETDAALQRIADAAGVSKNEAAVIAIHEHDTRTTRRSQIEELVAEAQGEYRTLLDRLGQ